jgi:hypothetical protein
MRTPRGPIAGLMALTLAAGLVACGSDDDSATTDTTGAASEVTEAPEADLTTFCDAVVEFNGSVMQVDISEESTPEEIAAAGTQLVDLFAPIKDGAPDSLAATADELAQSLDDLAGGDPEAFNADATFETYTGLLGGAIDACEYESVAVTGIDYAYQGVPETIPAGTTAFAFTNASEEEDHMMGIIRKKDGVTLSWDELLALPEDEAEGQTEFLGEAFAPPGGEGSALATLEPGDYAMICFIPVGSGEDGPPHFTEGMIQEFTVE